MNFEILCLYTVYCYCTDKYVFSNFLGMNQDLIDIGKNVCLTEIILDNASPAHMLAICCAFSELISELLHTNIHGSEKVY